MPTRLFSLMVAAAMVCPIGTGHAQPDDPVTAEQANRRPARSLSLRQALDVIVVQSPTLVRTEVDIAVADATVTEADGLDDWVLSATGAWISNRREFVDTQPFQTVSDDTLSVSGGLSRALPTGGSVGLQIDGNWTNSTFAVLDPLQRRFDVDSKTKTGSIVATFSHPLLGGRGRAIAHAARRQAKLAKDATTLSRQIAALATVRQVIESYWELAYAERAVEIQRGSLELARQQLRLTRAAIAGNVAAPTEALAVEQAIAVREEALLLAQLNISEQSLAVRELVGMEVGPGEINLTIADTAAADDRAIDLDDLLARAKANNPQLALATITARQANINVEIAADAMKPRLDLAANFGPSGSSEDFGDTLSQIGGFKGLTLGASLTYTQTLKRRAATGARNRARHQRRRVDIDRDALDRQISVLVVRAVNLVRIARKRIEVSDLAIRLAEQNLDAEKILFQAGNSRAFEVLARQDQLALAKLTRARAVIDSLKSLAGLDALTGELLSRHGVDVASAK